MRLTDRDGKIVELIERWGVMSVEDICIFMQYKSRNSAYWRLNRIVEAGLINRVKTPFGYCLYASKRFRGLDVATFGHDQTAKRLALKLSRELDCQYQTVRELRSAAVDKLGVAGLSKKVPDFILIKDDKKIAVEVELSQKSLDRQRSIFDKYIEGLQAGEFMQIFYYCGSAAILERVNLVIQEKDVGRFIRSVMLPNMVRHGSK